MTAYRIDGSMVTMWKEKISLLCMIKTKGNQISFFMLTLLSCTNICHSRRRETKTQTKVMLHFWELTGRRAYIIFISFKNLKEQRSLYFVFRDNWITFFGFHTQEAQTLERYMCQEKSTGKTCFQGSGVTHTFNFADVNLKVPWLENFHDIHRST